MYWTDSENVRKWLARNGLAAAFAISLIVHSLLFGGWRLGKNLGWWDHQATWLLNITKKLQTNRAMARLTPPPPPEPQLREIPLTFMEVDPTVAVVDVPKDAKFYGAQNALAANTDPRDKAVPKVDGKQTKVVRTEDVPKPFPLQPSVAPAPPAPEPPQPKPKAEAPGDLAKLEMKAPAAQQKPIVPDKPRTLAAARERKNILAGQKVEQDGGAKIRGKVSFDVKATPFGAYDAAFIAAVQQRWYDLLDSSHFTQQSGKVVLEFRLMYDGRITDMKVNGNDVGELLGLLCQRAVLDPAPYAQWPSDMRRAIGQNYREVTFTFFYN
jgi:hypothetical protein